MSDYELRLECLRLATVVGVHGQMAVDHADKYWQFVKHASRGSAAEFAAAAAEFEAAQIAKRTA